MLSSLLLAAGLTGAPAGAAEPPVAAGMTQGFDSIGTWLRTGIERLVPGDLRKDWQKRPAERPPEVTRIIERREQRLMKRLKADYPEARDGLWRDPGKVRQWRRQALEEQARVLAGAFQEAMYSRLNLRSLGSASEDYAKDRRNWSPQMFLAAAVIGSPVFYLDGLKMKVPAGRRLRLGLDLGSGRALQRALTQGGLHPGLAAFQISLNDKPIALAAEWGYGPGGWYRDRIGLRYQKAF